MNGISSWDQVVSILSSYKQIALFLDYDGTLTPIAPKPELALLDPEIKNLLSKLALKYPMGIISGRDRSNVEQLVGINRIYYAGSHGFDIMGPFHSFCMLQKGDEWSLLLEALAKEANNLDLKGIEVKACSVAIHYRLIPEEELTPFFKKIDQLKKKFPKLQVKEGKKVVEFLPNITWDKGKALLWLLEVMQLEGSDVCPLFIGDDITDEDAFLVVKKRGGVSFAVLDEMRDTHAQFTLKSVEEVKKVLEFLC